MHGLISHISLNAQLLHTPGGPFPEIGSLGRRLSLWVPHVRLSVHGTKKTGVAPPMFRAGIFVTHGVKAIEKTPFSAHVRWREHGAPVQDRQPSSVVMNLVISLLW